MYVMQEEAPSLRLDDQSLVLGKNAWCVRPVSELLAQGRACRASKRYLAEMTARLGGDACYWTVGCGIHSPNSLELYCIEYSLLEFFLVSTR